VCTDKHLSNGLVKDEYRINLTLFRTTGHTYFQKKIKNMCRVFETQVETIPNQYSVNIIQVIFKFFDFFHSRSISS
jgi:hypothetical protein